MTGTECFLPTQESEDFYMASLGGLWPLVASGPLEFDLLYALLVYVLTRLSNGLITTEPCTELRNLLFVTSVRELSPSRPALP